MHLGHLFFLTGGRISRGVWWLTQIGLWLFLALTMWLYKSFGFHDAVFGAVLTFVLFCVRLNVNIKRCHDRNKSGWWMVLFEGPVATWLFLYPLFGFNNWCFLLLPIVGVCSLWGFIELGIRGSHPEENEHGSPAT